MLILVDTSVWIDLLRNRHSLAVQKLEKALAAEKPLATCDIIVAEILQGCRDDLTARRTERRLAALYQLPLARAEYIMAARISRALRGHGFAVRGLIDCLVAAAAIRHNAALLHCDRDYARIARFFPLQLM